MFYSLYLRNVFWAGGIVLQQEASQQIFYIFPNATRYKISDSGELIALGLQKETVIREVPYEVITAFPPVHAAHD